MRDSTAPNIRPGKDTDAATKRTYVDIKSEIVGSAFQITEDVQIALAERVTSYVLDHYWSELQKQHNTNLPFPTPELKSEMPPKEEIQSLLKELGTALAKLHVEDAAYEVGQLYTMFLPKDLRARRGIFYTPPALARRLIDKASNAGTNWEKAQIIDPACGGGAFLVPAALQIIRSLEGASPAMVARNLQTRLEGWEIGQYSSWLTRFFIEVAAAPITAQTGKLIDPNIRTIDSLQCSEEEFSRFDLVIGNPPFGRKRLEAETRARYSRSLYGHANLYGIFTELAVRLARQGGIVAYLTPASFLAGEYFKNLRRLLWEESPPVSLDFVESRKGVFDGVLQETVLATYRKHRKKSSAKVSAIHLDLDRLDIANAGTFKLPKEATSPWIIARHSDDKQVVSQISKLPSRLADWGYTVSTGPLVWNRHKDQLVGRKLKNCIPIIWSESVTPDGQFQFRSEKKNHEPYFKLKGSRDTWLKESQECVLLQRTTAKEQKRRLIAAPMPSEFINRYDCVTVENHLNMIYPIVKKPAVSIEVLSAFLNSEAADRVFRCLSGSVAVSAYEIESLPLPGKDQLTKLKRLVSRKASKDAIEAECRALYGQGQ
jgi:adenine-specific DNA-methyltransferase